MPSSLSSLFPSVGGVRTGGEQIPDSCTTIAEAFRDAGYLTCAMIRNDFVGRTTHTEQGFDFFFPSAEVGPGPANNVALAALLRRAGQNPDLIGGAGGGFNSGSSRDLFTAVEPWLAKYSEIPFFLYMHSVEPHGPYDPPPPYDTMFLGRHPIAREPTIGRQQTPEAVTDLQAAYDASIRFVDDELGRLFDGLRSRGTLDHTLVLITSDHGESFMEHGHMGHGASLYLTELQVPLVIDGEVDRAFTGADGVRRAARRHQLSRAELSPYARRLSSGDPALETVHSSL